MTTLKKIALVVASLLFLLAFCVGALVAAAPWLDGPVLQIAGGPFKQPSVDFSTLAPAKLQDAQVVEIEVKGLSRPSVTVGVLVFQEEIFVPATLQPDEKRWPKAIEDNPQIRMRHGNEVVDAFAYRVLDRDLHQQLCELGAQKYEASYFQPDRTWYFRISETAI